ncbi:MAG: SIMPL domain-containing protein [Ilumatobacteraceae bacterium]
MRTSLGITLAAGAAIGVLSLGAVTGIALQGDRKTEVLVESGSDGVGRTIAVSGAGIVTVAPDTATIGLGVQVTGPTATEALERANVAATALIEAVKDTGIDAADITTTSINVYPMYNSSNRINGYNASNSITVKVRDLDRTGEVIDVAAAAAGGVVMISGISFFVDDTEPVLADARAAAIDNAVERARQYADAAGVDVGDVLQISEVTVAYTPIYEEGDKPSDGGSTPTPVEPGSQQLSVSVTVVFELT